MLKPDQWKKKGAGVFFIDLTIMTIRRTETCLILPLCLMLPGIDCGERTTKTRIDSRPYVATLPAEPEVFLPGPSPRPLSATQFTIEVDGPTIQVGDTVYLNMMVARAALAEPETETTCPKIDGWTIEVDGPKTHAEYRLPLPLELCAADDVGTRFTAQLSLFYFFSKTNGELRGTVFFGEPGAYRIGLKREETLRSNTIEVQVLPSVAGSKAISILETPGDFAFLLHGQFESPARIEKIERIAEECRGSEMADLACARLGMIYMDRFKKKHPSLEKFRAESGEVRRGEESLKKAVTYLRRAKTIPLRHPLHEEVLHNLAQAAYADRNDWEVKALLAAIVEKHPNSPLAGRAARELGKESATATFTSPAD